MVLDSSIKVTDLLIVIATFTGPVAAVLVSLWRERRRSKRDVKFGVFSTLMATRRMIIHSEHVRAINLIELAFYGDSDVIKIWAEYKAHLDTQVDPESVQYKKWDDDRNKILANLLSSMATNLGYYFESLDIFSGGYAPSGWQYRDSRQGELLDYLLKVARGKDAIRVKIAVK